MFFSRRRESWSQSLTKAETVSSRQSTLQMLVGSRISRSSVFALEKEKVENGKLEAN